METINASPSSLKWQCRRGMLELDLLLNDFVVIAEKDLSSDERETFKRLLAYPDQVLLDLLLSNTVSSDDSIHEFVQRIRQAQRKK